VRAPRRAATRITIQARRSARSLNAQKARVALSNGFCRIKAVGARTVQQLARRGADHQIRGMTNLELSDEEAAVLARELVLIRVSKIAGILFALVEVTSAAAQTRRLPIPTLSPTIYSRPTPAPLAPPVNPGPAVVPPAGLSPLLTEPGPVFPPLQRAMPVYPPLQLPGPVGQQNLRAYRNSLLGQQWQRERSGISPGSERSREIQQQLNQTSPQ
jgi:hypothetical protein